MIRMGGQALRTLEDDARRAYPHEGCGALLGRASAHGPRAVVRAVPLANTHEEERERRYLIGPDDVLRMEEAAEADGLELVGFYHSHPDHPAVPSEFDREHAWPWYVYVIVPVADGRPGRPRAWELAPDRSTFREATFQSTPAPPRRQQA